MKTIITILIAATLLAGYMVADKASTLVSKVQSEKIVALNQIK